MKISLHWLKECLALDGVKFPVNAKDLAEKLTHRGFEVEALKECGAGLQGVVIGLVKTATKHPNADKLSLCEVDLGSLGVKRIVCGAANVRAGLTVAVATEGTLLPNGLKIKSAKIRGEFSEGMICSETELGFATEAAGIMELASGLKPGLPLTEALAHLSDTLLELNITPNRPDCLGHLGVAREVAALLGTQLKYPEVKLGKVMPNSDLQIDVEDREGCPAYLGRLMRGIRVQPSPLWVQERLKAVGLRPINQVVDATNYVLMEFGHPTHAFDARFLEGKRIRVCAAERAQDFRTLDAKPQALLAGDLLICDAQKPIALAGIMGGENSEIREDTRDVVLECAYFAPKRIRLTARRLGLKTDSSYRFERGVDPGALERVMDRLSQLIVDWTKEGGAAAPEVFAVVAKKASLPPPRQIALDVSWLNARLGGLSGGRGPLTGAEISQLLQGIGLKSSESKGVLTVDVPRLRADLERSVDLLEEVTRLYGFERIASTLPNLPLRSVTEQPVLLAKRRAHEVMAKHGFREAIHYSFGPADDASRLGISEATPATSLVLRNPLAEDQSMLRQSLLPGLLRATHYNLHRGAKEIRLYEAGKVFSETAAGANGTPQAPRESLSLAGVMLGNCAEESWAQETKALDFYDLKGVVEDLLKVFLPNSAQVDYQPASQAFLHPGKSAQIGLSLDKKQSLTLGYLGEIHPETCARFDLQAQIWTFALNFDAIFNLKGSQAGVCFRPLALYPAIRRDLALVVQENLTSQAVYQLISSLNKDIIESIHLFDVYRGSQLPEGKKSLAYAIYYLSRERTLTHEEIDRCHENLLKKLNSELGAEIRT